MADADLSTALRDSQLLEGERTCLDDTATRGSTVEEREAAVAWLQRAARNEHQVAEVQVLRRRRPGPRLGAGRRPRRNGGAHRNGNGPPTATTVMRAPDAPPPLPQVEALRRQQQRILHRSALIDYVLAAETRGGGPLTMGDALAELLADITEAARTIGALLQPTTGRVR